MQDVRSVSAASDREVADLDYALGLDGQWIFLRSITPGSANPPYFEVQCRASVRGYRAEELVGGITQQDSRVILSPTQIIEAGWPGPATVPTDQDRRIPKKGDKAVINGKVRNVESAVGIYVDDGLCRIEMRVLG